MIYMSIVVTGENGNLILISIVIEIQCILAIIFVVKVGLLGISSVLMVKPDGYI